MSHERLIRLSQNRTVPDIIFNAFMAAVALFVNGFGVYLTMHAGIGAAPWDVFNLGLSKTFGILYGTASIAVSLTILFIDIMLKEPIGLVSIGLLSTATLAGFLLGGPVGIGTIICALCQGPIMQMAFKSLSFDATLIKHQSIPESIRVMVHKAA